MLVSRSLTAERLSNSPVVLLCLKCASTDCRCGRLAWLVNFVNDADSAEGAADAPEPVFGSIDCAASERVDASAELEALFVLKPRDE